MGNSDRRRFLAGLITAMRAVIVVFLAGCVVVVLSLSQDTRPAQSPEYTFKILREFPHDVTAFTQGLAYRGGFLYEGTGLKGRSSVRKVRLETGAVVQQLDLPSEYFGEGITLFKNEIIEVTWQSGTGFVYDATNFRLLQRFSYKGEGWGLTTDGHDLFMSDGTDVIRVLDPNTFAEKRHLQVHDGTTSIWQLNALGFVNGQIFANVWHSDRIARISPQTGAVVGWIELQGLLSPVYLSNPEAVLNGIAYDPATKRLFVTGKLWPYIFEIRLIPKH